MLPLIFQDCLQLPDYNKEKNTVFYIFGYIQNGILACIYSICYIVFLI